jgi:hypothetical protein
MASISNRPLGRRRGRAEVVAAHDALLAGVCTLPWHGARGVVGRQGARLMRVYIPPAPFLAGLRMYQQALVLDAAAGNPAGLVVSDAATVVIGNWQPIPPRARALPERGSDDQAGAGRTGGEGSRHRHNPLVFLGSLWSDPGPFSSPVSSLFPP